MASERRKKMDLYIRAGEAFTPGRPVNSMDLFAGRIHIVRDVLNAVFQSGMHVILYGERGVGKTSLANVLAELYANRKGSFLRAVDVNGNSITDFGRMWKTIFRRLGVPCEHDEVEIDPELVKELLDHASKPLLVIIDEVDRIDDQECLSLLADTIKTLSDSAVDVTLVLVGVADSIDTLIGDHASVQRALVQTPMPRMSHEELCDIVNRGVEYMEMGVDEDARVAIANLSLGFPYYAHLVGLHALESAIADDRTVVMMSDVDRAIGVAVQKSEQTHKKDHHKATRSPREDNLFAQALLACALAPKDDLGFFSARVVKEPMSRIMGRKFEIPAFSAHLKKFCTNRGPVLERIGEARKRMYRFVDPLLQPFVVLHGLDRGLVTQEVVDQFRSKAT